VNILRYLREQAREYRCTACGADHGRSEIKLVGRVESAWIVRVICASCRTEFRLLVVVDEAKAVAMKQDHPSGVRNKPPVTLDEVLDTHELLRTYSGSLDDLLSVPAALARPTERGPDPT
jgi:hypothetical protein